MFSYRRPANYLVGRKIVYPIDGIDITWRVWNVGMGDSVTLDRVYSPGEVVKSESLRLPLDVVNEYLKRG